MYKVNKKNRINILIIVWIITTENKFLRRIKSVVLQVNKKKINKKTSISKLLWYKDEIIINLWTKI